MCGLCEQTTRHGALLCQLDARGLAELRHEWDACIHFGAYNRPAGLFLWMSIPA